MKPTIQARVLSELLGTGFLVSAVIGSGIMAERLSNGNVALALLANSVATGAALVALILAFGPVSGAHLNPMVSIVDAMEGGLSKIEMGAYISAQVAGGIFGVIVTHLMFQLPIILPAHRIRSGPSQWFSEFVATFGLVSVIWGCSRSRVSMTPVAVAGYITAAYWFTSSTSFANPAVTIARAFSDTFAGIRLADVPGFVVAQLAGGVLATLTFRLLLPGLPSAASNVAQPRVGS